MDSDKRVLSVTEAARMLGISRNLAYAGITRGEIPCLKIGKRILVPKIALEKMLDETKSLSPQKRW